MKSENIKNLWNNVSYLIKAYKIRVGDLENTIGVSKGYLSRMSGSDLPISKVISLADFFEITIDELVHGDFHKAYLTGEIKRLQKELDSLELAKELESEDNT